MHRDTVLLGLTLVLVLVGCVLYALGLVGLAQTLWVLASGTAGAGVISWIDLHHDQSGG